MADHSIGPIYYGINAMKIAKKPIDVELNWQIDHIPNELKELVLKTLKIKKIIN